MARFGTMISDRRAGEGLALVAALSFGAAAPIAKLLLEDVSRLVLSGLLYVGAGLGLFAWMLVRKRTTEAPLDRRDVPILAAMVAIGGVAAPFLLLYGLERTSGFAGSLGLAMELPITVLLALTFFGESASRREVLGLLVTIAGTLLLLGSESGLGAVQLSGLAAVIGAAGLWALDSNLMQRLSGKDPAAIAAAKCATAGTASLALALLSGERIPSDVPLVGASLLVGFFGYGVSIACFAAALRRLGTARTGALFATAPFLGGLIAIPIFAILPTMWGWLSGIVLAIGVGILIAARHEHEHAHVALEHDHRHVHDEHHRHDHAPGDPAGEPHAHRHRHEPLTHAHSHVADLHHRHGHD